MVATHNVKFNLHTQTLRGQYKKLFLIRHPILQVVASLCKARNFVKFLFIGKKKFTTYRQRSLSWWREIKHRSMHQKCGEGIGFRCSLDHRWGGTASLSTQPTRGRGQNRQQQDRIVVYNHWKGLTDIIRSKSSLSMIYCTDKSPPYQLWENLTLEWRSCSRPCLTFLCRSRKR